VIENEINPQVWFGSRELAFTPKHFVLAKTKLSSESKTWILNKLSGRFSLVQCTDDFNEFILTGDNLRFPAFEDPAEAVLYELYWS
jgi:hypothetical protein